MTSYHGGKQKLGRVIANVIRAKFDEIEDVDGFRPKGYCEPFCGMMGVYRHIPGVFGDISYTAGDINESVIDMWSATQQGWVPPTDCTEERYKELKSAEPSAEKGFVGHACSFGGQYFMGYKNKYLVSDSEERKATRLSSQTNRVVKIAEGCTRVKFSAGEYTQFSDLVDNVIYCDPPYENINSRYLDEGGHKRTFNHTQFWDWCREMGTRNKIIVSGFSAPEGFERIWGLEKPRTAHGKNPSTGVEGLYELLPE
jgi:DNA adenine methylase